MLTMAQTGTRLANLPVVFSPLGLDIPRHVLSAEQYTELGHQLRQLGHSLLWWWGDYLNAFEEDWGEMYSQALEQSDYSYGTLRNAKWVCGQIPLSLRNDKLSFTHHLYVVPADPALRFLLLDQAANERWSAETLRLAVREERDPFAQPTQEEAPPRMCLDNPATWSASYAVAEAKARGDVPGPSLVYAETARESHQLINASTSNEWYTPAPFLDAAHQLMGGVDLDPASTAFANQVVRATQFFTLDDDGFAQAWSGRVWLNPPYGIDDGESNQSRWSRRLDEDYRQGRVTEALLLVNAVPGNRWFRPLWQYPICFPESRIRFYNEETEAGQPTHSNAIVYFGPQVRRFAAIFARFGTVAASEEVWRNAV